MVILQAILGCLWKNGKVRARMGKGWRQGSGEVEGWNGMADKGTGRGKNKRYPIQNDGLDPSMALYSNCSIIHIFTLVETQWHNGTANIHNQHSCISKMYRCIAPPANSIPKLHTHYCSAAWPTGQSARRDASNVVYRPCYTATPYTAKQQICLAISALHKRVSDVYAMPILVPVVQISGR